ncbi:MAG: hypothetical protein ACO2ON_01360, partial [Candidatus Nanopusillus sp.]
YAFTSGVFDSLISSSSQQIQQQSQMVSFTISNVYCSNNIVYFNIYNNGNVPININNSVIIFTDNNGNTIPINGSNIICNNGNIIPSRSSSLCHIVNNPCYYDNINYIKSMNFVFSGISYNYNILDYDKFNLIHAFNFSNNSSFSNLSYVPITLYNTQNIPTPSPFQQQIAICNGTINISPNFAYVNNSTLFNSINSNGSNVYFTTTYNGTPNIYSWYLGQLINGSTYCRIWWIKLDNGIPANSNVTIYMYIGPNSANYYQQYYPYVGASPNVFPSRQYDNGKYVFIAYGYFNNTMDGWVGYNYSGSWIPRATLVGIQMTNGYGQGTYILPYNNWDIPLIPLIVEESVLFSGLLGFGVWGANIIALFGNTSQQFPVDPLLSNPPYYYITSNFTPIPNLSISAAFLSNAPFSQRLRLISTVTNRSLNSTDFPFGRHFYLYLIVNSTYAEAGLYPYSSTAFVPLTLLNTYSINRNGYTYANLDFNPFQYGTLQISAGNYGLSQYIQWVVVRAYPPNSVMPSIYIS